VSDYIDFLQQKRPAAQERGIRVDDLATHLFPYQSECVRFLLRMGSGGLFLDTGLGKTLCELEWSEHARNATNGRALILTPLAVAHQFADEGRKFGYNVHVIRDQSEVSDGINICNYDRLEKIDPDDFGSVALDESSIIKNFTGKTSRNLISAFASHRFRLSATATPAPNDHMELGQHASFCGVMSSVEMLSRFFINDTSTASQNWRLKRHGVTTFWDWMASWCRMAAMPSDLGDSDEGFILPPMKVHRHAVDSKLKAPEGDLFALDMVSATSMHDIKRQTAGERASISAQLATSNSEPWVIWVDTDYEADAVRERLRGARGVVEVRGSMSIEAKETALDQFADGTARVLITKPSICGFGLNWQHCAHTVFVGRTFSYEAWYQAVRRFWRFGQTREVQVHIAIAQGEESIGSVIDRKADDHAGMKTAMRAAMLRNIGKQSQTRVPYNPQHEGKLPSWLSAA
jgi:superfamily II DNA or RNA helicase